MRTGDPIIPYSSLTPNDSALSKRIDELTTEVAAEKSEGSSQAKPSKRPRKSRR